MTTRMPGFERPEALGVRPTHLRLVHPVAAPSSIPPPPVPDAEPSDVDTWWLDALRRGETSALTRLYHEHHVPVRALVRRLLGHAADVEDVVHDVFVAAPGAFKGYRGEGSVRSYLFTIAVHHARRHVRSATRRRSWLERLHLSRTPEPAPPPDMESERRELGGRLGAALAELSFDHRTIVVLCEIEELTSIEAAKILDIPEGTVRTRLHHAKKKLRARLSEGST